MKTLLLLVALATPAVAQVVPNTPSEPAPVPHAAPGQDFTPGGTRPEADRAGGGVDAGPVNSTPLSGAPQSNDAGRATSGLGR